MQLRHFCRVVSKLRHSTGMVTHLSPTAYCPWGQLTMILVQVPSALSWYNSEMQVRHFPPLGSKVAQVREALKQVQLVWYWLGAQVTDLRVQLPLMFSKLLGSAQLRQAPVNLSKSPQVGLASRHCPNLKYCRAGQVVLARQVPFWRMYPGIQREQTLVMVSKLAQGSPSVAVETVHPWKFAQQSPNSGLQGQAQASVWKVNQVLIVVSPGPPAEVVQQCSSRQNPESRQNSQCATLFEKEKLETILSLNLICSKVKLSLKGASKIPALLVYSTFPGEDRAHSLAVREVSVPKVILYRAGTRSAQAISDPEVFLALKGWKANWSAGELGATQITFTTLCLPVSVTFSRVCAGFAEPTLARVPLKYSTWMLTQSSLVIDPAGPVKDFLALNANLNSELVPEQPDGKTMVQVPWNEVVAVVGALNLKVLVLSVSLASPYVIAVGSVLFRNQRVRPAAMEAFRKFEEARLGTLMVTWMVHPTSSRPRSQTGTQAGFLKGLVDGSLSSSSYVQAYLRVEAA